MVQCILVLLALIPMRVFASEPLEPSQNGSIVNEKEMQPDETDPEEATTEVEGEIQDEDLSDDAEDTDQVIYGNIALASDYDLRGLSQTNYQPALQGGFDWGHTFGAGHGMELGTWGSNVLIPDVSASLELDFYGAYTYSFAENWKGSAGISYFSYFGDSGRNGWDFPFKLEWNTLKAEADFSPGWRGGGSVWYLSAGWSDELFWEVTFGSNLGYSVFSGTQSNLNYPDLRLSVSREFLRVRWEIDGVIVPQQEINGAVGSSRLIFLVSKAF